jgi:methanogenic corrinoid protein MtbC1
MIDLAKLKEIIGELDEEQLNALLNQFINSKPSQNEVQQVIVTCQQGMDIVGTNFEKGINFVADLIFASEIFTSAMAKLKPLLGSSVSSSRGVVVVGTVEGDIHDIGKNIFGVMAEAAGFKVVDIGIDQKPESFVKAVKENKANITGLSGVLSLSIDAMKRTVDTLFEAGLRSGIKVIIGGSPVNEEACKFVGADAWSQNAAEAVRLCGEWVKG